MCNNEVVFWLLNSAYYVFQVIARTVEVFLVKNVIKVGSVFFQYSRTSHNEPAFITDSSLRSKNAKLHILALQYRKLYNVDTWLSRIYLNKVEVEVKVSTQEHQTTPISPRKNFRNLLRSSKVLLNAFQALPLTFLSVWSFLRPCEPLGIHQGRIVIFSKILVDIFIRLRKRQISCYLFPSLFSKKKKLLVLSFTSNSQISEVKHKNQLFKSKKREKNRKHEDLRLVEKPFGNFQGFYRVQNFYCGTSPILQTINVFFLRERPFHSVQRPSFK